MRIIPVLLSSIVPMTLGSGLARCDAPGTEGGGLEDVRRTETIGLSSGPDVRVTFDAVTWKPWSRPKPGEKPFRMSWRPVGGDSPVLRVYSRSTKLDERAFTEQLALAQKVKNDPGVFVRSQRRRINGRDWLVLEYRYPSRRPTSHETVYFTATPKGHVHVSVFGDEAEFPARRGAISEFMRGVRIE